MGLNQNLWGRPVWKFLHSLTLAYPLEPTKDDKDNNLNFLKALGRVLPCEICKVHFGRNLVENPPRLNTKKDFFEWAVDVHNEVNGRTGKKAWTYEQALEHYEDIYQKDFALEKADQKGLNNKWFEEYCQGCYCFWIKYHMHLIIIILLGIIGYLLTKKGKKGMKIKWFI